MILLRHSDKDPKAVNKIFGAVLFIISHPRTFKSKPRAVIRAAYEERFGISVKQQAQLDKWKQEVGTEEESGSDTTTDKESFDESYGSEYS